MIFFLVKDIHELADTLKNLFEQKFLDLLLISFVFYIRNSLARKANWKQWSFTKLSLSFLYNETKKSWKRLKKCILEIEGVQSVCRCLSFCHIIEQFTDDLSFKYVKSVCKVL